MVGRARLLILLAILLVASSGHLSAQRVTGEVREVGFGRPVRGAIVTLLDTLDAVLGSVATDSTGSFSLRAPGAGRYRINLRRGEIYSVRTALFSLTADQVRRFQLEVPLPPVELPAVRATAERIPSAAMLGIEQRMKSGFGTFLTREQLDRAGTAIRLNELLREVSGLQIARDNRLGASYIELSRGGCPAKLVVNGVTVVRAPLKLGDEEILKEFLEYRAGDIEAVEIYKGPSETPGLFGGSDAQCGVVAVWLRRGG